MIKKETNRLWSIALRTPSN